MLLSCSAAGGALQHVTGRSESRWHPRRRSLGAVCQALGDRDVHSAGPPEALSALHEESAVADTSTVVSSLVVLPPQPSELLEWPFGTKRTNAGLQLKVRGIPTSPPRPVYILASAVQRLSRGGARRKPLRALPRRRCAARYTARLVEL